MAAVTICSDLGAPKNKVWHCFHCFAIYLPWSDGMILVFWMFSFKPAFSLSSFIFIKRLFSSSSLYSIRVVSSAYLRLLIFLLAILIPASASYNPAFCIMHSAYKVNKDFFSALYKHALSLFNNIINCLPCIMYYVGGYFNFSYL